MTTRAELHVHLDGAVEPETLLEIDPSLTREEIAAHTVFTDFAGFIQSFVWVNQHLKTPEDYARAGRRLFERLENEGAVYAEVILSAGVVLWKQQPFAPIYDALVREAARSRVKVRWILDAIRQFGAEPAKAVFELSAERVGDGVVAFGICEAGARRPIAP